MSDEYLDYLRRTCIELGVEDQFDRLKGMDIDDVAEFFRQRGEVLRQEAAELREFQRRRRGENVVKMR